MPDYFKTIKRSFVDVPVGADDSIETVAFLEACEELCKLFDTMGASFTPVKNDLQGNITKIRTKYLESPATSTTLQSLVTSERAAGKKTATEGLLWLKRGLEFTSKGLRRNLNDKKEELNVSFQKAYEETLSAFHNFLVRPVFALAMKACPYRKDFYAKLGADENEVYAEMEKWLAALEKIVAILVAFYSVNKYDKF
ncbi:hypothetical protein HK104_000172 [Borealophlyctis nickersoniae]|nr:hypothetical protein HK104_000172 [Borealophlyctis nickersoniae]